MPADPIQHRGLLATLHRRLDAFGFEHCRVIDELFARLEEDRQQHGELDLANLARFVLRFDAGKKLDDALYAICRDIHLHDLERAALRERARDEMFADTLPVLSGQALIEWRRGASSPEPTVQIGLGDDLGDPVPVDSDAPAGTYQRGGGG